MGLITLRCKVFLPYEDELEMDHDRIGTQPKGVWKWRRQTMRSQDIETTTAYTSTKTLVTTYSGILKLVEEPLDEVNVKWEEAIALESEEEYETTEDGQNNFNEEGEENNEDEDG